MANGKVDGAAVAGRILASVIAAGEVGQDDLRIAWSSPSRPGPVQCWQVDLAALHEPPGPRRQRRAAGGRYRRHAAARRT
ncbi:hypothetical protein [Pseudomonas putida]|uniref:hypothetical protein n=1 Tax=Pseudomonas putida TaxID=303 RepID=UPI003CC80E27